MAIRRTALTLAVLTIGCGDVEPLGTGTLELSWRVAPTGCEEAGVDVVEVRATGPHAVVERFSCSREHASLAELTPGTYRLEVLGFDANGTPTFRANAADADVAADEVVAPPEFRLVAAPASVRVSWSFANGKVCGANNARWVSVSAFDQYDYEVAVADFACDDGAGELPALRAGNYQIQATALDAAAKPIFRGTAPTKLGRGEALELAIALDEI